MKMWNKKKTKENKTWIVWYVLLNETKQSVATEAKLHKACEHRQSEREMLLQDLRWAGAMEAPQNADMM